MLKAHKIRLHPTPEQAAYFAQAAGTSRFVWNWALAQWDRQYDETATTKFFVGVCLHTFAYENWSRIP